jgi:hypothetical protein
MGGGNVQRGKAHHLVMQRARVKEKLALEKARESKSLRTLLSLFGKQWEGRVPETEPLLRISGNDDDL